MTRTREAPDDLLKIIRNLERRIKDLESSQRAGFTSFEAGQLKLISDFPEIDFLPLGPDALRQGSLYAFDFGTGTPGDAAGTALTLLIESFDPVGGFDSAGGKVLFWNTGAVLSLNNHADGIPESFLWLGAGGSDIMDLQGRFYNQTQSSSQQAVYAGTFDASAGFGSFTHSYFQAFSTTVVPVCTVLNSAGALSWCITAQSTSSFTVAWTGTLAKTVNFWNVRL